MKCLQYWQFLQPWKWHPQTSALLHFYFGFSLCCNSFILGFCIISEIRRHKWFLSKTAFLCKWTAEKWLTFCPLKINLESRETLPHPLWGNPVHIFFFQWKKNSIACCVFPFRYQNKFVPVWLMPCHEMYRKGNTKHKILAASNFYAIFSMARILCQH